MNDIVYVGRNPILNVQKFHSHSTWEIICCTAGTGSITLENETLSYHQGQCVLLPPHQRHFEKECSAENIYLHLSDPLLAGKEAVLLEAQPQPYFLEALEAALFHFHSASPDRYALLSSYGSILSCYLSAPLAAGHQPDIAEEIEQHILMHFESTTYELDDYLHTLPFSYDYLRRLFQKRTGSTPHRFLEDKRLKKASELLTGPKSQNLTIADVAHRCGYREPLYFSRVFKKKYGFSPSLFQKLFKDV